MTPTDRLRAARLAAREGRFAEALSEYVWFHEHALEEEPALCGVRLSFALGDWLRLAKAYPPALEALHRIRDEKSKLLSEGAERWELLEDVAAINEQLGADERTYALFCHIRELSPTFAARCASVVMPAIVKARDFELARQLTPEPERVVEELAAGLNEYVEQSEPAISPDGRLSPVDVHVRIYAEEVSMLADIVREAGEPVRSAELLGQAVASVSSEQTRDAVGRELGA